LDALKKRQVELEKRAKDEFECSVDELPALIEQLEKEAEVSLANAEKILGMREGDPEPEPESQASDESDGEDALPDEDGIGI